MLCAKVPAKLTCMNPIFLVLITQFVGALHDYQHTCEDEYSNLSFCSR